MRRGRQQTGASTALAAVAFQDHILRGLGEPLTAAGPVGGRGSGGRHVGRRPGAAAQPTVDTGLKKKPVKKSLLEEEPAERVLDGDRLPRPPSLAQRLGLVPGDPGQPLAEHEWSHVKRLAGDRGDYESPCVICKELLGVSAQVLLSCSHTFHRACLSAFERFTGRRCCPLCRKNSYQKRLIHEATRAHKAACATRIQAVWRGHVVRCWYRRLRQTHPPNDPKLREKFFYSRLCEITDRMENMYCGCDIDGFIRDLDCALDDSRRIMAGFSLDGMRMTDDQWEAIVERGRRRLEEDCAICMAGLTGGKELALCSCSHVFHAACLATLEELSLSEFTLCPVCRSCYQTRTLDTL